MSSPVQQTLSYERPRDRNRPRAHLLRPHVALRVAFVCGVAPAALGTLIIVLWLATRYDGLLLAGFFNILLGLAGVCIGIVALVCYFRVSRESDGRPRRVWLRGALAGAVLVLNFPLCLAYVRVYDNVSNRFIVTVVNAASQPIDSFFVTDPSGGRLVFGNVQPGQMVTRHFRPRGDGEVAFRAVVAGATTDGVVSHYVTDGMSGGSATVVVNPGGSVTVR